MTYDVIIIGAGPAGLSAAIYTGRNRLNTLILSKDLGGQTALSGEVANYPGIKLVEGKELATMMLDHAKVEKSVTANIGPGNEVIGIIKSGSGYVVETADKNKHKTMTVIISTGKRPKTLGVPGEQEFTGRGVSVCATCDAPFFKNKVVAVIGGGYSATEATYMLAKYAQKIFVLTINDKLNGEAVTLEKLAAQKNITIVPFAHVSKILNDGQKVIGLEYKDSTNEEVKTLKCDGVFVEIGSAPNTQSFSGVARLNQWTEIEIDNKNATKMPGVFAAGDATSVWGKQVVIAAGEGAKAAMAVGEYLAKIK